MPSRCRLKQCAFFLVLLACLAPVLALPFYGAHYQELHGLPRIREGVLDLSAVPLEDVDWIPLNGKWHYYPSQWLQTDSPGEEPVHQWTMLPTMWNTSGQGESFSPRYGYGSYSLTINGFPRMVIAGTCFPIPGRKIRWQCWSARLRHTV